MVGDLDSGLGAVALVNGPGSPYRVARTALAFVTALRDGTPYELPEFEALDRIDGAGDYAASTGRSRAMRDRRRSPLPPTARG
jgi:hypothetical protein